MTKITSSFFAAGVALAMLLPATALADALPPDACEPGDVGKACTNAGTSANLPGTCVASTCNSPTPDGGSREYDCVICEESGSSSGGGGSSSGATTSSSGGGGSSGGGASSGGNSSGGSSSGSSSEAEDDGGCSTSPRTRDGLTSAGMLGLGLVAWAWSRRRRG